MRELALGARLTLAGGRTGLLRTLVTAIGVALGVAVLLVAASIPSIHDGRQARGQARSDLGFDQSATAESGAAGSGAAGGGAAGGGAAGGGAAGGGAAGGGAADGGAAGSGGAAGNGAADNGGAGVLVADADTRFRSRDIRGRLLEAEGAGAPAPPGVSRVPRAGEVFVSPALADTLASPDGRRLLAPRIPGRVVGEIGPSGLVGPTDLAFYAGAPGLTLGSGGVRRLTHFGSDDAPAGLDPVLTLLVVIVLVALLLPVAVLVGSAVRTGGEDRDRRLAALRLIGADQHMARRIAAGEALISAAAGLVLGTLMFLVLRTFADRISIWDTSVYAADVHPSALLGAAVVVGVPAAAVLVSLLALRRVVAEPLGVVRRAESARRRRLWWRLLLPALGLLALAPAAGGQDPDSISPLRVGVGVIALLIGVAALLPWVVERVVARLGAGKVAWQLAVRRLQLDPGGPARAVSGITVAVAGAIALQMVFTGVQDDYKKDTGADLNRATLYAEFNAYGDAASDDAAGGGAARGAAARGGVAAGGDVAAGSDAVTAARLVATLAPVPGVRSVAALSLYDTGRDPAAPDTPLTVAPCATLREVVAVTTCRDGDVFFADIPPRKQLAFGATTWAVPAGGREVATRADPTGERRDGVFATPGAVRGAKLPSAHVFSYVRTTPGQLDAIERVRNAAASLDPRVDVQELHRTRTDGQFAQLRRAMLIGASIVIGLIGLSLLLTALEQLRERRRLLAVLVAFGTRRSTLSWSVLWQSAVPVALGIGIAVLTGIALGSVLLRILGSAVQISWTDVVALAGVGVIVVLIVTAASLPVLWRTMRPEGLRTE